jgi:hypothetical protein
MCHLQARLEGKSLNPAYCPERQGQKLGSIAWN